MFSMYEGYVKFQLKNNVSVTFWFDGAQFWYKNDKCHRDNDLPAIIQANGSKYWYKNNKVHRDNDMPAIIYADGFQEWRKEGVQYVLEKV